MSIVRYDYRHIFCHVPKTGGMSMEEFPFIASRGHAQMSVLFNRCREQGYDPKDFYSWAFVRHPSDRLQSAYYSYKQHHHPGPVPPLAPTFAEFVEEFSAHPEWKDEYFALRPLKHWIDEHVSFIGFYEHIERDWAEISRHIIGRPVKLPHLNGTTRPRDPVESKLHPMIFDLYREDICTFYVRI